MDEKLRLLGHEVAKTRLAKGLTQEQLAVRSGIHRTYLSDIERGKRNISVSCLCSVAHALELEPETLVGIVK